MSMAKVQDWLRSSATSPSDKIMKERLKGLLASWARSGLKITLPLASLYRNTPDQQPIRERDQGEHEQEREPLQHARFHLVARRVLPEMASASVTIRLIVVRDSPTFAALFSHQPDYARCNWAQLSPIKAKSHSTHDVFGLSHQTTDSAHTSRKRRMLSH